MLRIDKRISSYHLHKKTLVLLIRLNLGASDLEYNVWYVDSGFPHHITSGDSNLKSKVSCSGPNEVLI